MDGSDEKNCSKWICNAGLYKCNRTGQCIDHKYFCDGELDCDDGEDEVPMKKKFTESTVETQTFFKKRNVSCSNALSSIHNAFECTAPYFRRNQTSYTVLVKSLTPLFCFESRIKTIQH